MSEKNKSLTAQARSGVIWTIIRSLSSQGARFIASMFLARLLFPEDFGIVGIVLIVTRLANRLGNFGFAQVLIQKKLIDETHVRTTFTVNLLIAVATTTVLFLAAPYIAGFVTKDSDAVRLPLVIDVLRVLSLNFILISLYAVPNSLLKRKLKFKQESIIGGIANVTKFLAPVGFAFAGFGVWSLVYGNVFGEVMYVIAFYSYARKAPRLGFDKQAFKEIFSFGMWMNLYSYVQYFYKNIDYFFISKFLGLGMLGFYERAYNLMNAPRKRVSDMINGILFATYSRIQDEEERMISAMKKVMSAVSMIIFPAMTWLYFASPSLIPIVYGDKWYPTIVPLQIMSISGLIESVTMIFFPAFIAKGLVNKRTKVHFKVMLILAGLVYYASHHSIVLVAWAIVISSFVGLLWNSHEYIRNSEWNWKYTFSSLRPALSMMGLLIPLLFATRWIGELYFSVHSVFMLIALTVMAALTFFGGNYIFKFAEVREIIDLATGKAFKKIKRKKQKDIADAKQT